MSRISLPHGGPDASFDAQELLDHLARGGTDYIIQGQVNCSLAVHPKPHSLDVWLRTNFTGYADTKQATNEVMESLAATGLFEVHENLICPDSGRRCKGLRAIK
jgi:hypothetical protein